MASPKFFQNLPNIQYAMSVDKAGNTNNVFIKDFFKSMRLRSDVFRSDTMYVEYVIKNGETPDMVSKRFYDNNEYYWAILQVNNITDYYNQWPLTSFELEQYIVKKYGVEGAGEAHHYITQEVKDNEGRIIQHAGLKVTKNYVFRYVDSTDATVELTSFPSPVTNRQYELKLNDEKSAIQVLDPKYILDYVREYKRWAQSKPDSKSSVDIGDSISA